MSKAEEIQMLNDVIQGMPAGYVHDILRDAAPEIESAIRSDFGYIPIKLRMDQAREYHQTIVELEKQKNALETTLRELKRTRNMLENGINELRSTAAHFAKL
jgi:hypothetical protein